MKKSILAIVALACMATLASAQRINFQMGDKSNKKAYHPAKIHIAEGHQPGQLLVVEPEFKSIAMGSELPTKALKVRLCDMEWNDIVRSVSIPNTKKTSIGEAFRSGDHMHLVLNCDEDNRLVVRHIKLDARSLEISADQALVDHPLQKGSESNVWSLSSPNGQYHGVVYAVWPKKGESQAVAMMFDKDMNKLWERRLVYADVFNVLVTDAGAIATMRMGTVEGNNDITAFRVNLATAEGEKHGEYVLDADVSDVALLKCEGSRVLATALEGKGGYGLLRIGTLGHRHYTGVWGLVFDLDSQKIVVGNRHPFTDDEMLALCNEESGQKFVGKGVQFVQKVDDCPTPQGGAVLYQRTWKETVRDMKTGMTKSETVYHKGILLVQADIQGGLAISRIPQNNQNASENPVGSSLFCRNGKVYVLTNESKHGTDEYTPDRPAERSRSLIMANAALAIYWFTPDGQGAKQMLETDRKAILFSPAYAGTEGRFYFLAGSMRPCLSSITIP